MDNKNIPCRYGEHYSDSVPMPFGSGNCSMPGFECNYDGDIEIDDDMICNEDSTCPAYAPVDTFICPEHGLYWDYCEKCLYSEEA
jgi:hypothetical protein